MQLFVVGEGHERCGGCNWDASKLVALADSQEDADRLFESGDAGMCGECMAEMLTEGSDVEGPYYISHTPPS